MMAAALVGSGCLYIPEELDLDIVLERAIDKDIVIRRSIPHRGEFIDLYTIASMAQMAGYAVTAIAIFREPHATSLSVFNRNGTPQGYVFENMIGAMTCISELSMGFQVLPITYEAITQSRGFQEWFFGYLGFLPINSNFFYDGNRKYYE